MDALAIAVMGLAFIACFVTGAKVGQAVQKGKDIELEFPTASPIESIKTHLSKKDAQKEQNRLEAIMKNIEAYDGTSFGQRDIPRR
jgi:hypothetical protein